jgi:hypothetical protein
MSDAPRRGPSEAEWQRLDTSFGIFFVVTLAVAVIFVLGAPFPPLVSAVLMSPLIVSSGWVWIMVIRRRDIGRLHRLNSFAARRRRRPGPRR